MKSFFLKIFPYLSLSTMSIVVFFIFFENSGQSYDTKGSQSNSVSQKPALKNARVGEKLDKDEDLAVRENMVSISRQLGVTCTYCHDINNFKFDKKETYAIAREHIRITTLLNEQGFKGKPRVSCNLCHRGHAKISSSNY